MSTRGVIYSTHLTQVSESLRLGERRVAWSIPDSVFPDSLSLCSKLCNIMDKISFLIFVVSNIDR